MLEFWSQQNMMKVYFEKIFLRTRCQYVISQIHHTHPILSHEFIGIASHYPDCTLFPAYEDITRGRLGTVFPAYEDIIRGRLGPECLATRDCNTPDLVGIH